MNKLVSIICPLSYFFPIISLLSLLYCHYLISLHNIWTYKKELIIRSSASFSGNDSYSFHDFSGSPSPWGVFSPRRSDYRTGKSSRSTLYHMSRWSGMNCQCFHLSNVFLNAYLICMFNLRTSAFSLSLSTTKKRTPKSQNFPKQLHMHS